MLRLLGARRLNLHLGVVRLHHHEPGVAEELLRVDTWLLALRFFATRRLVARLLAVGRLFDARRARRGRRLGAAHLLHRLCLHRRSRVRRLGHNRARLFATARRFELVDTPLLRGDGRQRPRALARLAAAPVAIAPVAVATATALAVTLTLGTLLLRLRLALLLLGLLGLRLLWLLRLLLFAGVLRLLLRALACRTLLSTLALLATLVAVFSALASALARLAAVVALLTAALLAVAALLEAAVLLAVAAVAAAVATASFATSVPAPVSPAFAPVLIAATLVAARLARRLRGLDGGRWCGGRRLHDAAGGLLRLEKPEEAGEEANSRVYSGTRCRGHGLHDRCGLGRLGARLGRQGRRLRGRDGLD